MMKTKFLSFLGTNPYLECSYYFEYPEKEFYPTRFVQIAIIRKLLKQRFLSSQSQILIFATDEAYNKNWYDNEFKGEKLQGLNESLQTLEKEKINDSPKFPHFERIPLAEGKSEEELWEIFNTLAKNVDYGDAIYFDITHSFRSLPMLTMIVLNFLRVTKNVEIKGIYYGAFETLGNINDIKKLDVALRKAPIFDLTPFVDLFYWTSAAYEFITTGNTKLLTELTKRKVQPILKAKKGMDESASVLNKLSKQLIIFSQALLVNNGPGLPTIISDLFKTINLSKDHVKKIPPLEDLFNIILDSFSSFQEHHEVFNKLNFAIDYCFKHGLLQQGFTLLEENFISFGCHHAGLDYENSTHRQLFTSAMHIQENNLKKDEWKTVQGMDEQQFYLLIDNILRNDLKRFNEFKNKLFPIRNALNHASFTDKNKQNYNKLKDKGQQLLNEFKDLIRDEYKEI